MYGGIKEIYSKGIELFYSYSLEWCASVSHTGPSPIVNSAPTFTINNFVQYLSRMLHRRNIASLNSFERGGVSPEFPAMRRFAVDAGAKMRYYIPTPHRINYY